jgi:hypothetical protein
MVASSQTKPALGSVALQFFLCLFRPMKAATIPDTILDALSLADASWRPILLKGLQAVALPAGPGRRRFFAD